jgi:hypothetical protein
MACLVKMSDLSPGVAGCVAGCVAVSGVLCRRRLRLNASSASGVLLLCERIFGNGFTFYPPPGDIRMALDRISRRELVPLRHVSPDNITSAETSSNHPLYAGFPSLVVEKLARPLVPFLKPTHAEAASQGGARCGGGFRVVPQLPLFPVASLWDLQGTCGTRSTAETQRRRRRFAILFRGDSYLC